MGKVYACLFIGLISTIGLEAQDYHEITSFVSSAYFLSVVSADFNGDGYNDVAISNADNTRVEIYLNKGDGTFGATPDHLYALDSGIDKLVTGFFDSGTTYDIAVLLFEENTIQALLGNGDGTFTKGAKAMPTNEMSATYISTFKETSDGMHLVALGNKFAGSITLYRPIGDGSFAAPDIFSTIYNAEFIGAGDIDNDGDIDLAVGNGSGNTMMFHLNDGTGDYTDTQEFVVPNSAGHECLFADLNDDDVTDMIVVLHNYDVNSMRVYHGKLGGGFDEVQVLDGGNYPVSAEMHDLDGKDGLDVVTADNDGFYLFHNDGNGNLVRSDSIIFTAFRARACTASKLNSDRYYDFVAVSNNNGGRVFLSGTGSSARSIPEATAGLILHQNYPNPVCSNTIIPFSVAVKSVLRVNLYSIDGRYIRTLSSGLYSPGPHVVVSDLSGLTSGSYFYRLESAQHSVQRMMTVVE